MADEYIPSGSIRESILGYIPQSLCLILLVPTVTLFAVTPQLLLYRFHHRWNLPNPIEHADCPDNARAREQARGPTAEQLIAEAAYQRAWERYAEQLEEYRRERDREASFEQDQARFELMQFQSQLIRTNAGEPYPHPTYYDHEEDGHFDGAPGWAQAQAQDEAQAQAPAQAHAPIPAQDDQMLRAGGQRAGVNQPPRPQQGPPKELQFAQQALTRLAAFVASNIEQITFQTVKRFAVAIAWLVFYGIAYKALFPSSLAPERSVKCSGATLSEDGLWVCPPMSSAPKGCA
ncbi:hypothetical protein F5Y15DRAFT_419519 [Xylariaceae sp. FL0016]|nr:hypothetical protein F5Y15DRAFT_419519 [Xylariaceae sp. FL0016]